MGRQSGDFQLGTMADSEEVLNALEVIDLLRQRWQASYDINLVRRHGRLYLHVMWGHLEQQSFPMVEEDYVNKVAEIVGMLNGLGVAHQVRQWLTTTDDRPRLGKALSLPLHLPPGRASEFLL